MKDIRRKYNPIVDLSKFTSNKKILNKIVVIDYKLVSTQTLPSNSRDSNGSKIYI